MSKKNKAVEVDIIETDRHKGDQVDLQVKVKKKTIGQIQKNLAKTRYLPWCLPAKKDKSNQLMKLSKLLSLSTTCMTYKGGSYGKTGKIWRQNPT